MDLQLKDKFALVTGSTAGIGYAIAEALAQEGTTVAINGRSKERVNLAIQQIQTRHPDANLIAAVADLSNKNEVETLINWTLDCNDQIKNKDVILC